MADGDIQLTVSLNTEDVRAKAEQLRGSISNMFKNASGQELSSSLASILNQMDKVYTKSTNLEAQLKRMDSANLSGLRQAYTETEQELRRCYEILESMNQSTDPEGYQTVLNEIQAWEGALQQISADYDHISQYGSGGMGYEEYDNTIAKLNEVNNQMVVLQARAQNASGSVSSVGTNASNSASQAESSINRVATAESNVATQATNASSQIQSSFSGMTSSANSVSSSFTSVFDTLSNSITSSQSQITKLTSMLKSSLTSALNKVKSSITSTFSASSIKSAITTLVKYTIGVRSLYFLFRKLRTAIKEGLENLVQYDSQNNATNEAITSLNTSLLYLKNAWASAFAPIINYVMPLLTSLIDMLADVANEIAKFVGNLTGQEIVLNAVKVQAEDYAESLSDTADSADSASSSTKKLTDRLASFDDLNVLGQDSDTGSGSGSGTGSSSYSPDIDDMFEYVEATSSFAEMIKNAWNTADFTEVSATIKDKLIEVLTIDWENDVYPYAVKIGSSAGSFIAGLFGDPELYTTVGSDIAGAINTVTYAVQAFLDETEGVDFGGNLAQGFNTFLTETDWLGLATAIHDGLDQIITNIDSFIEDLQAEDIAGALSDVIEGLEIGDLVCKVADLALDVTVLTVKVLSNLIVDLSDVVADDLEVKAKEAKVMIIDGVEYEVSQDIDPNEHPLLALYDSINYDFWSLADKSFTLATGQTMVEAVDEITASFDLLKESAKEAFDDAWGNDIKAFFEKLQEDIDAVVLLFDVLKTGAEELGYVFVDFWVNVVDGWEDFSEKWNDFWALFEGFDIEDLLEGIGEGVSTYVIEPLVNLFNTFTEFGSDIVEGLKNGITTALEGIGDWVSTNIVEPIVNAFCNLFGIHSPSTVFEGFGIDLIQGLLNGIDSLIGSVEQIFTDLSNWLTETWDSIKSTALQKWILLKTSIVTKVSEIKSSVEEKFNAIKTKVVEVSENIRASALEKFIMLRTSIVTVFEKLGDLIKAPINTVIGIVESFINKIISGINSLTGGFTDIVDSLGDVASQVGLPTVSISAIPSVSIPRLAQGAVIPPNREFMAILGDQKSGTNIEAPLDTIKQAVAEELSTQLEVLESGFASVVNAINNKNLSIGDKQIGQANARYVRQQNLIRGTNF